MKSTVQLEIKKATHNKFFLLSILIGCAITMISFASNLDIYQIHQTMLKEIPEYSEGLYNPYTETYSLYNHWIGGEPFSSGTVLYFFIFPLLAAIPYGWSYCEEKKNGYVPTMIVRTGKKNYFFAKYVSVFLSGGLAMTIPLLFNFLLMAAVIPAVTPDVIYDTYTGVFGGSFMSYLYYTMPLLYVGLYLCIDFIFGGLIACISYAVSSFIRQKVVVVILPFFLVLLMNYSTQFVYTESIRYKELSPVYFLRAAESRYPASWDVILLEAAVLLVITMVISMIWERKHEIY